MGNIFEQKKQNTCEGQQTWKWDGFELTCACMKLLLPLRRFGGVRHARCDQLGDARLHLLVGRVDSLALPSLPHLGVVNGHALGFVCAPCIAMRSELVWIDELLAILTAFELWQLPLCRKHLVRHLPEAFLIGRILGGCRRCTSSAVTGRVGSIDP